MSHGGLKRARSWKRRRIQPKEAYSSPGLLYSERGHILTDRGRRQLLGLEQMSLILPNLLGPELVRWLVKILRKIADDANVGFCGTMGIVATLEFFQHLFA